MSPIHIPFIRHLSWPVLLALLLCQRIDGQNLVPNPSFEDVNNCAEFNQPCSPSAWFFLSRKLTTGYFPMFPSATGHRHLQIVAASRVTANRQYWETMLLCPLLAGEKYTVTLKIATPANKTDLSTHPPNLRDIGLWFTTRFVFVQGDSLLQPRSFFSFSGAATKDLKNGWFEIKKEYTPAANASILIIGNFIRATNTDIMEQRSWPGQTIDILVDDISVIPTKNQTCPGYQKVNDSLYSITRRHSDNSPEDEDTTVHPPAMNPSNNAPRQQNRDRFVDSLQHAQTDSVEDPLFGPEPHRTIETPSPPQLPPATDTIIIHNIQFDFDKYLVQNPDTLQRYRSLLTRPGIKKIQVVGFTDDIGSRAYNQDLSGKRAREIARLLSSKFQISPALIQAEGRGISRDYPSKELNRRVEIYIFHDR